MLALRLEFLTGRAIVTAYNDRRRAEWPPHPARVFSALVATWAEQDPLDSTDASAERAALEWLEALPAPAIACEEGVARTVLTHYVPTNDVSLLSRQDWGIIERMVDQSNAALASLADCRKEALAAEVNGKRTLVGKAQKAVARVEQCVVRASSDLSARLLNVPTKFSASDFKSAAELAPEARGRQPRHFPSLALPEPIVHLIWDAPADSAHRAALDRLAARLVRVGHSSSFVHARWVTQAPPATWIPHKRGELFLRATGPGQFGRLVEDFERHRGVEPRILPFAPERYRASEDLRAEAGPDIRHFDDRDWIVLKRAGGPSLPLTRAVDLAQAIRASLMRYADQPVAEVLSGHQPNGESSLGPHLAIVPLPNVGHQHADGAIKGVALLIPRTADERDRAAVLRAIGHWEQHARVEIGDEEAEAPTLTVGLRYGVAVELERQVWGDGGLSTLQPQSWCLRAREWLSVTPVALDRNPGDLRHRNPAKREEAFRAAGEIIARACGNVGLPLPQAVTVMPSGTWPGGAKAVQFPAFPADPGKLRRVKVHARVLFQEPVAGPVLLGAGRFFGLGLFKPIRDNAS